MLASALIGVVWRLLRSLATVAVVLGSSIAVTTPAMAVPECRGVAATIVGTDGPDTLHGTADRDVIVALGGADTVYGRDGRDLICGGDGADVLVGGPKGDLLVGGDGDDTLRGGLGRDALDDGAGDDVVNGGEAVDRFLPGAGNDRLVGGPSGAHAADALMFSSSSAGVSVDLAAATAHGADIGHDVVVRMTDVLGSRFDDEIAGDDNANRLQGSSGSDHVIGRGGDDDVIGYDFEDAGGPIEPDDDVLDGGTGNDRLTDDMNSTLASWPYGDDQLLGGPGDDWLQSNGGSDHLEGGSGTDSLSTAFDGGDPDRFMDVDLAAGTAAMPYGNATLTAIEDVFGSGGDDTIRGDDGPNTLYGGGGTDTVDGRGGDDVLYGDSNEQTHIWTDSVDGGDGTDTCDAEQEANCEL